jgi:hypothetical protein
MIGAQQGAGEEQDREGTCQGIGIVCIDWFLAVCRSYFAITTKIKIMPQIR